MLYNYEFNWAFYIKGILIYQIIDVSDSSHIYSDWGLNMDYIFKGLSQNKYNIYVYPFIAIINKIRIFYQLNGDVKLRIVSRVNSPSLAESNFNRSHYYIRVIAENLIKQVIAHKRIVDYAFRHPQQIIDEDRHSTIYKWILKKQ